ncbi:selenocysteine insertion sequence-binding protein 2-like [Patella vulgata]|uniref:selenocysteine insertion sequence-binding protein 2-like n=1 Tax=Patella vulgata TaxID=6465 RepID=UPI00217F2D32|nr:selenocysteine insertion sequence-binding protein 2-like [Patella vulgata]
MDHLKYPFTPMSYAGIPAYVKHKNISTPVVNNNFTRPAVAGLLPVPQPWNDTRTFNGFQQRGNNVRRVSEQTAIAPSSNLKRETDIKVPVKIKMKDSQCQTDFPKEIADLHLKELPNTLFLPEKNVKKEGPRKKNSINSDGGLNCQQDHSMHKNVISSGTHPLSQPTKDPLKETVSYSMMAQKPTIPKLENKITNEANLSSDGDGKSTENVGTTKKKRKRNRKKKKQNTASTNEEVIDSVESVEVNIHLEDEFEFPDLSGKKRTTLNRSNPHAINTSHKLEQAIKDTCTTETQNGVVNSEKENLVEVENVDFDPQNGNLLAFKQAGETKSARKRRKRQDQANKAAKDEMAEITIEQQMLQELGLKSKQEQPSVKEVVPSVPAKTKSNKNNRKSNQPIALDFAAMIDALEQRRDDAETTKNAPKKPAIRKKVKPAEIEPPRRPHNPLDSTCPTVKRGKEREFPKPKKPSPLKKVILKEREQKKKLRLLDEDPEVASGGSQVCVGVVNTESDLSQDGEERTKGSASAELSPISQTSPFSMSPLSPSASPLHSGFNSPIAKDSSNPALLKIHSRRYREYCTQILDKDIDNCCLQFLQNLVRYQDKQYHKDPKKAKTKRRIVLGLREVTKHLKLMKIKCVIISPNLEKIQSKGGLDDALNNILNMCTEQEVPYVFALGRRALGRACAKLVPVSVVGVFNYEGSEKQFWRLIELTQKATDSYKEMVSVVEKDLQENPNNRMGPANVPTLFAHMGHSRTPSGCSAISFTSSILSEPISENYPYSEPETDSKGFEVSKTGRGALKGIKSSVINEKSAAIYELDAGNEADTEDFAEATEPTNKPKYSNSFKKDEEDPEDDPDNIEELPHIDSIHYGSYDLSVEILSQHSSRTIENSEAMSTHSSKTLRDGSPTLLLDKYTERHNPTPHKIIDKDRIQSWVEATQSCTEETHVDGSADETTTHLADGEIDQCDNSEKEDAAVS